MPAHASTIQARWPHVAQTVRDIERLRTTVADLSAEPFFEPVSLIDWPQQGRRRFVNFTPFHFIAGLRHASGSARARMTMLEGAILATLAEVGVYPAAVLVRSHMEAAGVAALMLVDGTAALKSGDLSSVQDDVLSLFLGTSLRREAKKNETIDENLLISETAFISAAKLVGALDRYVAMNDDAPRAFRAAYAVLCDYAHASMRVSRRFSKVLEEMDEGWVIEYGHPEATDDQEVEMIVSLLHRSMRVGHSAAKMLQHIEIVPVDDDSFTIEPPPEAVAQWVRTELLQHENPDSEAEDH